MRLPSIVVAVVLLFSSAVFAQHSSSAPSSPAPSSPPPAPAPSPSSSGASSSSSSASSSHSAPSSPAPSSSPSSSASSSGYSSGSNHISIPSASSRPSEPAPERINPEPKIGSEEKLVPSSRIGDHPAEKEKDKNQEHRAPESDLRRPICKDGPCKEVAPKEPVVSDLRRPVCKGKECVCPPGEVHGTNGGCVAAPTNNAGACAAGEYWNGGACTASARQCSSDTYWNGASCVARTADCATINATAASLANEVRGARVQMQNACSNNSSGQECSDLKQNYEVAVERYRMLTNGAPANCRSMVPDPLSL